MKEIIFDFGDFIIDAELNESPTKTPLISLSEFIRSGRSPVNMRWAIQVHGTSLESSGVIIRYGNKWLVSETDLHQWLRNQAKIKKH